MRYAPLHFSPLQSQFDGYAEILETLADYMTSLKKRTIIMAVVSAKNDYANQIILKKCRDVDPEGHRTLGIITKPDFLEAGTVRRYRTISLSHLGCWHGSERSDVNPFEPKDLSCRSAVRIR